MTDVRLYQTVDCGEINIVNGQEELSDGLETAAFLSLFGGNEQDSGLAGDDGKQFWGNVTETDPARTYRCETENLLRSIPATSGNLKRIEDAVSRDLAWMLDEVADEVTASVSIPALNTVRIDILIVVDGRKFPLEFTDAWKNRTQ